MSQVRLTDLAKVLRAAGLEVVELDGWRTRSRPESSGGFNPVGILWHHTGSTANGRPQAQSMATVGRPDLPPPLAQLAVDRQGVWYVLAAGRANHAGTAKASGSVAAGDGNSLYLGVEVQNDGSEGWTKTQYDSMVKGGVALGKYIGCTVRAQRAHKETSVTGKWDPGLLNMDKFRADIARAARPEPKAPTLRLVTFNCFVGQSPQALHKNLISLAIAAKRPHVIALQEAKNLKNTIPGYNRVAVKPSDDRPEAHSCVLLIRHDVEILRERPVIIDGPDWIGPHKGIKHRPRVFVGATIKAEGRVWDVLNVHRVVGGRRKNKLAWQAEATTLEAWSLSRRTAHPNRPVIILGDQNARKLRLRAFAKRIFSSLALRGIDGALVRNADATAADMAGRFGSDSHNPVLITAIALPREK